ncbi:MAG: HEAT repeat domain-containing protein [Candidatus Aminicenantes bacterium]|nr:MAG: HEAT repeat domain-containing protein [Candidatus Aminicenantes bacterium]
MTALIIVIILKSLVLLMAILILTWFMRRSSAAIRHLYLSAAVMVLLALPLVSLVIPSWDMEWFSHPFAPGDVKTVVTPAERVEIPMESDTGKARFQSPSSGKSSQLYWFDWILAVWLVGAVGLLLRLVGGKFFGYWVARKAPEISDKGFMNTVEQVAHQLGVMEEITILESDRFNVPFVSGILRPRLIMPSHAKTWPSQRLKNILHHELAHVKRKDILIQFLAQVVCCIYWVNPLVWILERQLFLERERACDDMALDQDIKASEYAGHLMEVLEEMGNKTYNNLWVITAMAEGTDFKDRILSILNPTARRRSPQRMHSRAVIVLALLFLLPFGAFSPWAAADKPSEESSPALAALDPGDRDESKKPGETTVKESKESSQGTGEQNKPQLSLFLELLKSPSASVREHAASALGELGDLRAVPELIKALRDEDAVVREHAATALGRLGDKQAVPALIKVLRDEDAVVREHAATALAKLGDKQAVPALIRALRDENAVVREHVASALGRLGDKRAVQPLNQALQKEKNHNVQVHILSALKKLR